MKTPKEYQIIIIEPSLIVREGIKSLLESNPEFQIARCYSDFQSFVDKSKNQPADIILVNPELITPHKRFLVKNFFPGQPNALLMAILYSYVDPETVNGFDGFIDLYDDRRQIVGKLKKTLILKIKHEHQPDNIDLSEREKGVLIAFAQGYTSKEVADRLNISIHTAVSHRKNISRKTGIRTVSGLTIYALLNGLISQEDLQ
jgi:DNA-binding NarL/FixJ family response regulator